MTIKIGKIEISFAETDTKDEAWEKGQQVGRVAYYADYKGVINNPYTKKSLGDQFKHGYSEAIDLL